MKRTTSIGLAAVLLLAGGTLRAAEKMRYEAENAELNAERVETVARPKFSGGKGAMLKTGVQDKIDRAEGAPDLLFRVRVPEDGRYWITSLADTQGAAREKMHRAANKFDSLRVMIAVDDDFPRNRVVVVPWGNQDGCFQKLQKYDLSAGEHLVKIWLPEGSALDRIEVAPYRAPRVPEAARTFRPPMLPPEAHPRLWVTPESLPQVRANLDAPGHREVWEALRKEAAQTLKTHTDAPVMEFRPELQNLAARKAFVSLMTGDRKLGAEAVEMMSEYLGKVEFGNMLDITREVGQVIYAGALVYDWCYDLMTPAQRETMRRGMMRLAEDMEIGWPPFLQTVVNGHGNESQVNRDLLAMSIAVYGDDNQPYQYCAYQILGVLVPMRDFEYRCSRHNQGIGYGIFRFGCEMHAAWLLRRMSGREAFHDGIKKLYYYWLYARWPDTSMLQDGDGSLTTPGWSSPQTAFLCYTYAADPLIKGDFEQQNGVAGDPMLWLLLNDPKLPADRNFNQLPLTHYFKGVLGSMIARTGWNFSAGSSDVAVEMKGADYHFGNHQHADAGAFQIFYRGLLATDLGIYGFYGRPYDFGFNKRSIAHNVMLAYDPDEKFPGGSVNDGGQKFNQTCPTSVEQLRNDPRFRIGSILAADFGPSKQRPFYSYLKSDLRNAYSAKIKAYTRSFCFLNLANADHPAALITVDRMTTARPEFRKYWLLNSLTRPEVVDNRLTIVSDRELLPGKLAVDMLLPRANRLEMVGGPAVNTVFGVKLTPPVPGAAQANGWRSSYTPETARERDVFVSVMQILPAEEKPLPVGFVENAENCQISLADRVVVLGTGDRPVSKPFPLTVSDGDQPRQVLLTDLEPGIWNVRGDTVVRQFEVGKESGTVWMLLNDGEYTVSPGRAEGARTWTAPDLPAPEVLNPGRHRVTVGKQPIEKPETLCLDGRVLVPVRETVAALGGATEARDGKLTLRIGGRSAVLSADSREMLLDGDRLELSAPVVVRDGIWYVPDYLPAGLGNCRFAADPVDGSVLYLPSDKPQELLWIESNCALNEGDVARMADDYPDKTHYWAVSGKGKWFELTLADPPMLRGIGVRWSQGSSRVARYKLEVYDGQAWQTIHDGDSRKSRDLEISEFPARRVRKVRFTGNGNTVNDWNSVVSFKLIPADR